MRLRERIGEKGLELVVPAQRYREPASRRKDEEHAERIDALRPERDFLDAGDEAIRRALSDDSEGFLRANRQYGGE